VSWEKVVDGFSYLLARLLDLLENGVVGNRALDDDFLLLKRDIERGNICTPEV
jgi:hypothetical protein